MAKKVKKQKVETFVLDASLTLAWYFKDEANRYADEVVSRFPDVQAVVPTIWPLEVANALLAGERRKRSTEAQATKWLGYLGCLPIAVDDEATARAWSDVFGLARGQNVSVYDAAYLELARRRSLALATLDAKLKAAAKAIGIREFRP